MANINIFALGGQDENGKNSLVLEVEKDIYVINAGIKVPINNRNGIDGIIPEFKYIIDRKENVKGLFLTHAHDENFAALPWLLMEMQGLTIYGSKFTLDVAKDRIVKYKLGHADYKFVEIQKDQKIGSINVKSFEVANSIPGSLAYNFQTTDGDVLVMSNMIVDQLGVFGNTDLEKIKAESKEILALCLDSRTANFNGSSKDKKSVKPFLVNEFKKAKDNERIIVGAYDEEMFNLQEVMELAKEFNRPVISYGRAFDFLYSELKNNPSVVSPEFIDYQKISTTNNAVVLVTGNWSRLYQRFVRIAENNDVYLKLRDTDHIIMMAPAINGMEVEYSETLDAVARTSPNIIDITESDLYKLRPAKQDIENIVTLFKPRFFVPLSALYRYLVVASKQAIKAGVTRDKNLILVNGKIAFLKDGLLASQKASIREYGDVLIDGFGVGDISFEVIKERQAMASSGLISIAAIVSKKDKKIVGETVIQLVGLAVKSEINKLQESINNIIIQKIEEAEKWDLKEIQNTIRKRVQKVMMKTINKEPLVVITFNEI